METLHKHPNSHHHKCGAYFEHINMCIVHRRDETGARRTASSWLRKRALWSNCTPHPWTKWIPRPLWPSREVSLDRSACSSTTQSRSSTCSAASLDASITRSRGRGDLSGRHGRGIDARATSETGETVTFHNRREKNWISLCVSSNPHVPLYKFSFDCLQILCHF